MKYVDSNHADCELPVPTHLRLRQWYDIEVRFDMEGQHAELYMNGEFKGVVAALQRQNTICYFNISSLDASRTGTDVYIDQFIVRDLGVNFPTIITVGDEMPL